MTRGDGTNIHTLPPAHREILTEYGLFMVCEQGTVHTHTHTHNPIHDVRSFNKIKKKSSTSIAELIQYCLYFVSIMYSVHTENTVHWV